jgi:hypothetical protein
VNFRFEPKQSRSVKDSTDMALMFWIEQPPNNLLIHT